MYGILSRCSTEIENCAIVNNKSSVIIIRKKERCIKETLEIIRVIIAEIDKFLEFPEYNKVHMRHLEEISTSVIEKVKKNRIFDKDQEFFQDKCFEESLNMELLLHGVNPDSVMAEVENWMKSRNENSDETSSTSLYVRKKYIKIRKQ